MATIDFDGSPTAYAPAGSNLPAQDYLGNAGHPGNWWALVTDNGRKDGNPLIDPNTGYYISATAWSHRENGSRQYVNADEVPYVAITQADRDQRGIKYGDFVLLTNDQTGRQVWAIAADYAGSKVERNNHSEVSPAAARALGIDFTKRGIRGPSTEQRGETTISMQFFPGSRVQGFFPNSSEDAQTVALGPQTYRQQTLLAMSGGSSSPSQTVVASSGGGAAPLPTRSLTEQAGQSFRPGSSSPGGETNKDDALAQTQMRDIQKQGAVVASGITAPGQDSNTGGEGSILASGLMDGNTGKMMGLLVAVLVLHKIFGDDEDSPNRSAFGNASGEDVPSSLAMIEENASDTASGAASYDSADSGVENLREPQRSVPALS